MIMPMFISCFTKGDAHGWGTFPKCEAKLNYHLAIGPSILECPQPKALHYIYTPKLRNNK
jgi:hypothetical protein